MFQITARQMWTFCEDFACKKYPHQRFGQAFLNTFAPGGYNDPDLFYCENRVQAEKLIEARGYINWEA